MSDATAVARDQLRAFIERIERLEEEKKTVADDIKDVYGEAKGVGFDTKILREVIKIRKQDKDERAEREAILDSYLAALGMIEQPGFFDDEPTQAKPIDRKARAARRTSEAMDDNKAFSAELVAAGLISEEANAENIALSDAVARKYGAGVIDPETGEVLDDRRPDLGLNIQTKHEDIRTAPETAEEAEPEAAAEVAGNDLREPVAAERGQIIREGDAPRETDRLSGDASCPDTEFQMDRATEGSFETGSEAAEKGREAIPAGPEGVDLSHAGAGESPATDQPLTGGDHEVASIAKREVDIDRNPNTGEGAACALPDNVELEYVPKSPAKRLPFSDCFPSHSEAEYKRLEKDIAANRVQEPIVRQGDVIIDGFARYCISRQYGMSYPVIEYSGTDVLLDVIEWQRASRNFTPAQEKKIAADLAREIPHRADDIFAAFGLAEALEAAE